VFAQSSLRFEHLSIEHGLPQSGVEAILQDQKGFLWFGTQNGLARYDGHIFRTYRRKYNDTNSLSANWVSTLYEDRRGNIWIALNGATKLNVFSPARQQFKRFSGLRLLNDSAKSIRAICEDSHGNIWLATAGAGLVVIHGDNHSIVAVHGKKSIGTHTIYAICRDSIRKTLWFATSGKLIKFDERTQSFYPLDGPSYLRNSSLGDSLVFTSLTLGKEGVLWAGTLDGQVLKFDLQTSEFAVYPSQQAVQKSLQKESIHVLCESPDGYLWVGTSASGVLRFHPSFAQTVRLYRHNPDDPYSLSGNSIHENTILCDRSGIVWIGVEGGGVNTYNALVQSFQSYQHIVGNAQTLSGNFVRSVFEDSQQRLWVGTEGNGLNCIYRRSGAVEHFDSRQAQGFRVVRSIAEDKQGYIWAATERGLQYWNPATRRWSQFALFLSSEGFQQKKKVPYSSDVFTVYCTSDNELWVSVRQTMIKISSDRTTVSEYPELPIIALGVWEDTSKDVWFATPRRGLVKFSPQTRRLQWYCHKEDEPTSISANSTAGVCRDSRGFLWVATTDGLNVLDEKRGMFRVLRDSVSESMDCYGVLEDRQGNLWVSTNNGGLLKIMLQFSGGVVIVDSMRYTFERFDVHDGLPSNEFNACAFAKGAGGQLYFGSIRGVVAFYPDSIRRSSYQPLPIITSFKKFNRDVVLATDIPYQQELRLAYKDNSFSFEFAALDFAAPMKNCYMYKLEGFDNDWVYTTASQRFATYTSLPAGAYTLYVKASNVSGVWSNRMARLRILIEPPFWQRWWFYCSALLLVASGVWTVHIMRLRNTVRRTLELERVRDAESNRIRKKAADDFHDEFGHKLTRIALLSEVVKRSLDTSDSVTPSASSTYQGNSEALDKIITTAKDLSTGMRDFLWTLNPDNDSLLEIAVRIKDFGDDFFDKTDVAFRTAGITPDLGTLRFSMDERRHIVLLFKEGMNNILKHAQSRNVCFEIAFHENSVVMLLSDDGQGFDTTVQYSGQGIQSMKNRAQKIGAELAIQSAVGHGTRICLSKNVG
jgi:ligand-binding sensor domain-containing protein/anti-sigma regulatory factor (Ser/Thr protein kinase)